MVVKKQVLTRAENPSIDDGWWASVLADEERHIVPIKPTAHGMAKNKSVDNHEPDLEKAIQPDWIQTKMIYDQDKIVQLTVTGCNRGGLLVEGQGLQGFIPFSHLVDMNNHPDGDGRMEFLTTYIGRTLDLKVIECVPEEGRVVFSERAAKSESGCRTRLFSELSVGQKIKGDVTNITEFGVFIDLGGVEGLIHISELSWGRVVHPADIVSLGENLEVMVIDVSPERCRVALSLKRLQPNPWETVRDRYLINDIVPATVTTIVSFGAFARLEEGLEGLIHVSEIQLENGKTLKEILTPGSKINVRILQVDSAHQRLGLSLKLEEK
jgi:small subunit ribosomal protein S1